jgi:tetratricopeptide (TPR) repeat protein
MAALKLLFETPNKFVWRSKGPLKCFGPGRWPRIFACLVLACLPVSAWSFGAAQQAAKSTAPPQAAVSATTSQQAVEFLNQGNKLLNRKDYVGAEAAYQKVLQSYPNSAAAHRGLGVTLWQEGALARAWEEMQTVARLEPDSPRAHDELSQLAWALYTTDAGRSAGIAGLSREDFRSLALSEMQKAVELDSHDFNTRLQLSQLELGAGRTKQAQADALGAVSLARSPVERSRAQVALARASFATGDQVGAEGEYKKALAENAANGAAFLGLGQICLFQQNMAGAVKYFRQAIQVSPDLAAAYAELGKLYVQRHNRGEALAMFQKAVALDPGDWQSEYEIGKLLMEAGEAARAKELFSKIVAAQPDFLPAGEQLALMSLRRGDVQGAITEAQALAERDPQAAEGHRVLALAFWRDRQTESSLAECAQALAVDPHSTSMLALQSLELYATKRHAEARRVLRQVARIDPAILSPVTFCRQVVCGSEDIALVRTFLHDNRWILATPADQ